jgi:hypothetical protein
MTAPERSRLQRMTALEHANEIRSKRAILKRDLKAGRIAVEDLLTDPPAYMETAKVWDLLLAVPKYGRVKVNKMLTRVRVSPTKTVGGLSVRQRHEIVAHLRGEEPEPAPPIPTPAISRYRRDIIPAPYRPPTLKRHMSTIEVDGMHDTACGIVVDRRSVTRDHGEVTCGNCRAVLAAGRRLTTA